MTQNKRTTGGDDWFAYQARKLAPKTPQPRPRPQQIDVAASATPQSKMIVEETDTSESMIQRIFNRRR